MIRRRRPGDGGEAAEHDALLGWAEALWRELRVPKAEQQLFQRAHHFARPEARPKTAPATRPASAGWQPVLSERLATTRHRVAPTQTPPAGDEPLAQHVASLLALRSSLQRLERAARAREDAVLAVKRAVKVLRSATVSRPAESLATAELHGALQEAHDSTCAVVDAVEVWRRLHWRPKVFVYRGNDYLEKCLSDLLCIDFDPSKEKELRGGDRALHNVLKQWRVREDALVWFGDGTHVPAAFTTSFGNTTGSFGRATFGATTTSLGASASAATFGTTATLGASASAGTLSSLRATGRDAGVTLLQAWMSGAWQAGVEAAAPCPAPVGDCSSQRVSLLREADLRSAVVREARLLAKAGIALPMLRWLPPKASEALTRASQNVFAAEAVEPKAAVQTRTTAPLRPRPTSANKSKRPSSAPALRRRAAQESGLYANPEPLARLTSASPPRCATPPRSAPLREPESSVRFSFESRNNSIGSRNNSIRSSFGASSMRSSGFAADKRSSSFATSSNALRAAVSLQKPPSPQSGWERRTSMRQRRTSFLIEQDDLDKPFKPTRRLSSLIRSKLTVELRAVGAWGKSAIDGKKVEACTTLQMWWRSKHARASSTELLDSLRRAKKRVSGVTISQWRARLQGCQGSNLVALELATTVNFSRASLTSSVRLQKRDGELVQVDMHNAVDLAKLKTPLERCWHGMRLRESLPAVPCVNGNGVGHSAFAARFAARQRHWRTGSLSGVFMLRVDLADTFDLSPMQWSPNTQWRPCGCDDADAGTELTANLLWCLRRGQRVCLVRGKAPTEVVWASGTVATIERTGEYVVVMDNGAGLRYDPTGNTSKSIILDAAQASRASGAVPGPLQRLGGVVYAPLPCDHAEAFHQRPDSESYASRVPDVPRSSESGFSEHDPKSARAARLFGFDIDENNVVVRVDHGSLADVQGVSHGWKLARVGIGGAFDDDVSRGVLHDCIEACCEKEVPLNLEFDCFSHELCGNGFDLPMHQKLALLHRTRWCDAVVLRAQLNGHNEALQDLGTTTRLRVFVGDDMETVAISLNSSNHCLRFLDAKAHTAEVSKWRADRHDWGEVFDNVQMRCSYRAAAKCSRMSYASFSQLQRHSHRASFETDKRRFPYDADDPPLVSAEDRITATLRRASMASLRRSSTGSSFASDDDLGARQKEGAVPRVYTWLAPPGASRHKAPCGAPWADVSDIRMLANALLHRGNIGQHRGRGASAPMRILLVDAGEASATRRKAMRLPLKRDETAPKVAAPVVEVKKSLNFNGISFSKDLKDAMRAANAAETVKAAARQIAAKWKKRTDADYEDIRSPKGQLLHLFTALSATRQQGDACGHYLPILIKHHALVRTVLRLEDAGAAVPHSLLTCYLESAYARSRKLVYHMMLQSLSTHRLVVLVDATPAGMKQGAYGKERVSGAQLIVEDYLRERLPLEVDRIVLVGNFSPAATEALKMRYVTLRVRRGSKADHETGLDAWFMAEFGAENDGSRRGEPAPEAGHRQRMITHVTH
ncbi:hypothetical protein M885DRAFT_618178 [Pelagophyceae sp. CCMP2097]|nr:hypothetical protein M885DRAFT_618178 [Pelagophyceae sp. CCMP2097]